MKLSEIRQTLTERGLQLTKSLGQNFLHDGNQLRRIVREAQLEQNDQVLEIGPGLGPLTELLLEQAGKVLAIEKDRRLMEVLRERFGKQLNPDARAGRLELVEGDALQYLRIEAQDWTDWKVVSNLPYTVASPILVELAMHKAGPKRMVATLQLEVAKRLMAVPGDEDYGLLTLLIQLQYEPVEWFRIPAGCFFPEPDVDSACAVLSRREQPPLSPAERDQFVAIVKRSFSQRRKMMAKLLKADWPGDTVEQAFSLVPLSLQTRAEAVSLEQFVSLTKLLYERRNL